MRPALAKYTLGTLRPHLDAAALLRRIPNDDPNDFAEHVAARIRSGEYQGREVLAGGESVGITVFFVESFGDHREFVSVATFVQPGREAARLQLHDALCRLARSHGCQSIRLHTVRHGLIRSALECGWHVAEITMRKNLS